MGQNTPKERRDRNAMLGKPAAAPAEPAIPLSGFFAACRRWRDWGFAVAITAVLLLVYQPAWHGGLLWDDDAHVTPEHLQSWTGLAHIWGKWKATPQYYPVVYTVFWIEHRLWGDDTFGYHLQNILLHSLAAFLVLRILRRLQVPGAYLAAAIFALHPVQVESVAWMTELKNTLSGVCYLAAMAAYLRFDGSRRWGWYSAAAALFLLALLSKTVTATLPAALLLIFWWQRGRLSWRRDVVPLLPLFTLASAFGVLSGWMESAVAGAKGSEFTWTIPERFLIAGRALWFYAGKLAWPAELVFIYPRWQVRQTAWWQYLFPVAAAVLLALLWRWRKRWRSPLAAALFFGGTLFPAMGFINVYPFRYSFVADHFQYLACLGIIVFAAAVTVRFFAGVRKSWLQFGTASVCLLLLAALAGKSREQTRIYRDAETMYRATIARNPDCWMAYGNLGNLLGMEGRVREAIPLCETALRLKPDNAESHSNLTDLLRRAGRVAEALQHGESALRIMPEMAEAHATYGLALAKADRPAEALEHLNRAIQIDPELAEGHANLGVVLAGVGRIPEAIEHYRRALQLKPQLAEAHTNLGIALATIGQFPAAVGEFREALRIAPHDAIVHNNLGNVLAYLGQPDAAILQYGQALGADPGFIEAQANLARVLAAAGRRAEAAEQWQRALRLAQAAGDEARAQEIRSEISALSAKQLGR